MKRTLSNFIRRLSGISSPVGGISWTPTADERQIVYKLLQRLGNRRLIRHHHGGFEYPAVVRSLEIMRSNVTDALAELSPESGARPLLEDIRTALHAFQDLLQEEYPQDRYRYDLGTEASPTSEVLEALQEMRSIVGRQVGRLSQIHEIPLSDTLVHNFAISLNKPA
jgi:hypothetical protein